ncbi:unnamed protein product [Chilo suppressalis]|uniref:BSD domain-containing protein n=1 Tax=Chilo suppressalis TaxID=168631 RepID=A0ABN8B104_CHISP|nr:unnamed protein product [Chilo suppressalis]
MVLQWQKSFWLSTYHVTECHDADFQQKAKSILGEFNREQDAFIKGQEGKGGAAVAPWVGAPNEPALKEECLSLSTDRRNFVRAPPAGVEFDLDYDKMYPVAVAIVAEDPNLEKMRFDLVPKVITEENFWRNYFYRLSLICQANEADAAASRQASADDSQDDRSTSDRVNANEKSCQESIDDAKSRIKSLKVDRDNEDEQWERELEAELNEYEVVAGHRADPTDPADDDDCDRLLAEQLDLNMTEHGPPPRIYISRFCVSRIQWLPATFIRSSVHLVKIDPRNGARAAICSSSCLRGVEKVPIWIA